MKSFATTFVAAIVLGSLASAHQPRYYHFAGSDLFLGRRDVTCGETCADCGSGFVDCGDNGCYAPDQGQSCCSNGDYCSAGQYCAADGSSCCDNDMTAAECNGTPSKPNGAKHCISTSFNAVVLAALGWVLVY